MITHTCPNCGHIFDTPGDSPTASEMGKKGGRNKSPEGIAKVTENLRKAREEGKSGGWPKGKPRKPKSS